MNSSLGVVKLFDYVFMATYNARQYQARITSDIFSILGQIRPEKPDQTYSSGRRALPHPPDRRKTNNENITVFKYSLLRHRAHLQHVPLLSTQLHR